MKDLIRRLLHENLDSLINRYSNTYTPPNDKSCGCCQYFDLNSINQYVEYDKPLYALVSKRRIGELKFVTPKQYIYNIAMGFGGLSYEDALNAYNADIGDKYVQAMKNGDKFPVGYYTVGDDRQEGRHRAMAAMKLGCGTIPVMAFSDVSKSMFTAYLEFYQGKSFERLDGLYKSKGYRGITMLGYRDLQRLLGIYGLGE